MVSTSSPQTQMSPSLAAVANDETQAFAGIASAAGFWGMLEHLPVAPANAHPWYGHSTSPAALMRPSERGARRWGHLSLTARHSPATKSNHMTSAVPRRVNANGWSLVVYSSKATGYQCLRHAIGAKVLASETAPAAFMRCGKPPLVREVGAPTWHRPARGIDGTPAGHDTGRVSTPVRGWRSEDRGVGAKNASAATTKAEVASASTSGRRVIQSTLRPTGARVGREEEQRWLVSEDMCLLKT